MLPRGPVWLALMCAISGVVEVARVAGGGKATGWFLHKAGNGDAVVLVNVVSVGSVVPFDVGELSEI